MNRKLIGTAALLVALPFCAQADASGTGDTISGPGAGTFQRGGRRSARRHKPHIDAETGGERSCTTSPWHRPGEAGPTSAHGQGH